MRIDHVIYGVQDLEKAAAHLYVEAGLGSVPGGRHPDLGTENRIVPLAPAYLELMAVADAAQPFAQVVAQRLGGGDGLLGWCVAVDDIDAVGARLGLDVIPGARIKPDGTELRWRYCGVAEAFAEPWLPFFIRWERGSAHPSTEKVRHAVETAGILEIELSGDEGRLRTWLDDAPLPYHVIEGEPGLHRLRIRTDRGETTIG